MSTQQYHKLMKLKQRPGRVADRHFAVEYGKMMMWFFLLSDAFTFSSLLISYGALRFSASCMACSRIGFPIGTGID